MLDANDRPMRADAARNRARLIEVAADAFAEQGLDASVNEVAARAGVSPATLYRHFATKDELIVAVADRLLEPLLAARDAALAADPGRCLEVFLERLQRLQAANQGLVDALLRTSASAAVRERLRTASAAAVAPLVERAHREGILDEDLDAHDLLIWPFTLGLLGGRGGGDLATERLERAVAVVLRGLAPAGRRGGTAEVG